MQFVFILYLWMSFVCPTSYIIFVQCFVHKSDRVLAYVNCLTFVMLWPFLADVAVCVIRNVKGGLMTYKCKLLGHLSAVESCLISNHTILFSYT